MSLGLTMATLIHREANPLSKCIDKTEAREVHREIKDKIVEKVAFLLAV